MIFILKKIHLIYFYIYKNSRFKKNNKIYFVVFLKILYIKKRVIKKKSNNK